MDENNGLAVEQVNIKLTKSMTSSGISNESRLAALWQSLYTENKVSSAQMPESYHIPWYIALMQASAAWVAALFLLVFIIAAAEMNFFRIEGHFIIYIGLGYLGIGLGLYLLASKQIFTQQFAFASCLSGVLGVGWGLYDVVGYGYSVTWYLTMAGILLLLWGLVAHGVAQFVFAFCFGWCLISIAAAKISLLALSPSVLVLIVSVLLLNLNWFGRHYQRGRMMVYAFVLALLNVQSISIFNIYPFFNTSFDPWWPMWWFSLVHVSIIFLIGSFLLVSIYRERQQSLISLSALACFIGLIFISGLSLYMQGLSTAILLILLGHYCNEPWLKGIGIVSALLFVSGYYYSLDITLLLKSSYLAGLGGVLLVARLVMWRLFPANKYAKGAV